MKRPHLVAGIGARAAALIVLVSSLLLIPFSASHSDMLPRKGTFKGVYHKNRAGVATFSYFLVAENLKAQLDKYEGRYIEIEVKQIGGPKQWGIPLIVAIGKITELPQAPIEIKIQIFPCVTEKPLPVDEAKVKELVKQLDSEEYKVRETAQGQIISMGENVIPVLKKSSEAPSLEVRAKIHKIMEYFDSRPRTFDFVVLLKNTGKKPVQICDWSILLWVCKYREVPPSSSTNQYAGIYTERQLSFGPDMQWDWPNQIFTAENSHYHGSRGSTAGTPDGVIKIMAGETVAKIWPGVTLGPGEHEIVVGEREINKAKGSHAPYVTRNLDVNAAVVNMPVLAKSSLKGEVKAEYPYNDATTHISGHISNPADKPLYALFLPARPLKPGMIQALDKDGKNVPISTMGTGREENPWGCREISKEGLKFTFTLRHATLFPERPIKTLILRVLSDKGAQPAVLLDNLDDKTAIQPVPWGKGENDFKCRVRAAIQKVKQGEKVRFYLQIDTDKALHQFFVFNSDNKWEDVQVKIDGKVLDKHIEVLWPHQIVVNTPYEMEFSLPKGLKLSKGKHALEIDLYPEDLQHGHKKLHLVSNTVEFEIEE